MVATLPLLWERFPVWLFRIKLKTGNGNWSKRRNSYGVFLCNRREYIVPQSAVRLYALRTLNTLSGQFDFSQIILLPNPCRR